MKLETNFWDKENWYKDGWKNCKIRQGLMLQKMYPAYIITDYVLWIVTDLYFESDRVNYKTNIEGSVQVIKKDGSRMQFTSKVKQPYPNKRLYQVTMMNGRKRGYGIPLIFKKFEELSEIIEISVTWTVDFINVEGMNFTSQIYEEKYYTHFSNENSATSENRVYTLFSNNMLGMGMFTSEEMTPYKQQNNHEERLNQLAQFDNVTITILNSKISPGYTERDVSYTTDQNGKIIPEIKSVETLSYKRGLLKLSDVTNIKDGCNLYKISLTKDVVLDAHYMANVDPEPCFGFPDEKEESMEEYISLLL